MITCSEITKKQDSREILWLIEELESTESIEGEYGEEQWNHEATPTGVDYYPIFGELYPHEDYHLFSIHTENGNQGLWRIESSNGEAALNTARELFTDYCDIFAP